MNAIETNSFQSKFIGGQCFGFELRYATKWEMRQAAHRLA
jgi:hypothetical protein